MLEEVHRLLKDHPHREELAKSVNYLQKREKMMDYPLFQQQGWPIGSGSAESANTCVVQSRLKGPVMHWEPRNVNPMLALRTGECNNRWNETRNQAFRHRLKTRLSSRFVRQEERSKELKQKVKEGILHLLLLFSLSKPITSEIPVSSSQAELAPPRMGWSGTTSVFRFGSTSG